MAETSLQEYTASHPDKNVLTPEQIELIKRTIAVGATDDELKLFLYTAQRLGLDPFARQIYFVKRKRRNPQTGQYEEVGQALVGIDGLRAIAERTGCYAPGPEPTFTYKDGKLYSATAYVKKLVAGEWHTVAATAFFDEYKQVDKQGNLMGLWGTMPHNQLAKCAEALALRKAFPIQLSNVYIPEEMDQAENPVTIDVKPEPKPQNGNGDMRAVFAAINKRLKGKYSDDVITSAMRMMLRVNSRAEVPPEKWREIRANLDSFLVALDETCEELVASFDDSELRAEEDASIEEIYDG
jgi:phage recombination protein Bet